MAPAEIEGRRIFDVKFLIEQLQNFGCHKNGRFGCSSRNMVFTHEIRKGFSVELYFKCNFCSFKEVIKSEKDYGKEECGQ